ncbi:serine hydrolase domain-containing protein [Arthrobacter sp. SPG23]|uniref:serine hydrolase domain-containing protein n=1 Tax=Arthrobacter sp. SPG23 TaxID=1610703 RepID=UPI000B211E0E|nr:serine hydrolase domain-containing protein [Arthrobacter sp. SPG23]
MPLSSGFAVPEFQAVRDLFESFLGNDPQYSAQVSVYRAGTKVVDLTGGHRLTKDSITGAYSCSKGVAAFVIALLVQDGLLDLDRTVAHYWTDFAAHGKEAITVRQALSHRAGLLGLEGGLALSEFTTAEAARKLAGTAPLWRPGTTFGYHALTIGIIMEELCRRVAGSSLQDMYASRIRRPFGIDFFLGLPEDQEPRYRDVLYDVDPGQPWLDPLGLEGLNGNAAVSTVMELPNHRVIRKHGMSSAGGVGSAEGLARLYAAATTGLDGGPAFLAPATISTMSEEQVWGAGPRVRARQRLCGGLHEAPPQPQLRQPPGVRPRRRQCSAGLCRPRLRSRVRLHSRDAGGGPNAGPCTPAGPCGTAGGGHRRAARAVGTYPRVGLSICSIFDAPLG